jgi:hypothetical protein
MRWILLLVIATACVGCRKDIQEARHVPPANAFAVVPA